MQLGERAMDHYDVTKEQLDLAAAALGLDLVGVVSARRLDELEPVLRRYYDEQRDSGFEHPFSELRLHPRALMPAVQTAIAIALPYHTASESLRHPTGRRHGAVSVYAQRTDYHRVLKDVLSRFSALLETCAARPAQFLPCVDTSPLVDRAYATAAGLGAIGKSGMLITKTYGTYVFLGVLLTDLRVEGADALHGALPWGTEVCGTCDLCLTACPTGALIAPYTLDAKRCLSYITQEHGIVPPEFRVSLGRRVWGCDTCQTVCPRNEDRAAPSTFGPPVTPLAYPDLLEILTLSNRALMKRIGHTAAAWRGPAIWRRNAIVALGNARSVEAIPVLVTYLAHARPELRAMSAWALAQIDPEATRTVVRQAYDVETDGGARCEMAWAREAPDAKG